MDEDDGQIARELVAVDEAFMRKDEDEEGTGPTLGLEQKCNFLSKRAPVHGRGARSKGGEKSVRMKQCTDFLYSILQPCLQHIPSK